ncbi:hypothetical protein I317_03118 [Kwoniella heveanensis CBS 569]|nr:hypothetical protein I317_03118 [Kwoniella heveanensis CBS 569]
MTSTTPTSSPDHFILGRSSNLQSRAAAARQTGGISFKYPSFKIHQSVTRFCLPLSKFNKLPSNKGKRLIVGALISVPADQLGLLPELKGPAERTQASPVPVSDQNTNLKIGSSSSPTPVSESASSSPDKSETDADPSPGHKILLVQRAAHEDCYPYHWEIPGGGAELGVDQTLLETVVREVKEETGLVVSAILGEFGGFEWPGTGDEEGSRYKQYNFVVEVELGQKRGQERTENGATGYGKAGSHRSDELVADVKPAAIGEPRPQIEVTLHDEEHQAYKWIGSADELEGLGLQMTVNQRRVVRDGLALIKVSLSLAVSLIYGARRGEFI